MSNVITRYSIIFSGIYFISALSVYAAEIKLAWDKNNNSNVIGYRAYIRQKWQSYNYDDWAWQGTNSSFVISDLNVDNEYCVVLRAINQHGESPDSVELCFILHSLNEDYDYDCDIDGIDLAAQALDLSTIGLQNLASKFGLSNCPNTISCQDDFFDDKDVDGADLAEFIFDTDRLGLEEFAANFGYINCH
jgi:hypothetical protein